MKQRSETVSFVTPAAPLQAAAPSSGPLPPSSEPRPVAGGGDSAFAGLPGALSPSFGAERATAPHCGCASSSPGCPPLSCTVPLFLSLQLGSERMAEPVLLFSYFFTTAEAPGRVCQQRRVCWEY